MIVKRLVVGVLQVNCYLIYDGISKTCLVVDPGDDGEKICDVIDKHHLQPIIIINTHYHFDHTGANGLLKDSYNVPLAIGRYDAPFLEGAYKAALEFMIKTEPSPKADILLFDGYKIHLQDEILTVMETPGHTKGSICLYAEKNAFLFSGDTLFYESVGRWDLPGGDKNKLFDSLDKILSLPKDAIIYPGHGPKSSIEHEIKYNPYKKGVLF